MRIVVAPDSFKGTATAAEIAKAIADGWRSERPDDNVVEAPMADGGEGTLDAFAVAYPDARRVPITVPGPDDNLVHTSWLRLPDGRGVVELASTSGLCLLDQSRPDTAHTLGFGRAIAAALDAGVEGLILGIGGSASTDGGHGMLVALGLRTEPFCDGPSTNEIPSTGSAALEHVVSVERSALRPLPPRGVAVLGDVDAPLLGPTGAVTVFGPQKGITPDRVEIHETRLTLWSSLFPDIDPMTPGAGAAGGTGFGLLAWGATITPGALSMASTLQLPQTLESADIVITGEGRYDAQTEGGKVASTVRRLAGGRPCLLVAGGVAADPVGFADAVALSQLADLAGAGCSDALRRPTHWAREAGRKLARTMPDHYVDRRNRSTAC
ncbi:glycerate kinase [Rhodococcus pyridinivorans]